MVEFFNLLTQKMKEIPSSKIQRTSRFVKTGLQIGGNYIKHYAQKLVNPELEKEALDKANAEDIYNTLSELKGSALKVAQMLSMDQGILPDAYSKKFAEAQYKAPALSAPLVVKTFTNHFGKSPLAIFDTFDLKAVHAASIGQVHRATKGDKTFAVKVQYPGVADSVISDLSFVKPVAKQLFGWKEAELAVYFEEVQERLVEETCYDLELERGSEIALACKALPDLHFPTYYSEYSSSRILTMDWMDGMHIDEFLKTNPTQAIRNKAGQALWDFYNYQLHVLNTMHADAPPGNFLFRADGSVVVLDFGCVKRFPKDFYATYSKLMKPEIMDNPDSFKAVCLEMGALRGDETPEREAFFLQIFHESVGMLLRPFYQGKYDFSDKAFFDELYAYGDSLAQKRNQLSDKPRGSQHGIYLNRTYFGIYTMMHTLAAEVDTLRHISL